MKRRVKERLKRYVKDQYAWDLIDKLLTLYPSKGIDADCSLNHDFLLDAGHPRLGQSLLEYLAPRGSMQAQPLPQHPRHKHNEGYQDRVF